MADRPVPGGVGLGCCSAIQPTPGKTPQFSDLYRDVQDGKVEKATFNSTTGDVTGKYKNGEEFHSTVPPAFTDFQKLMLDKERHRHRGAG